MRRALSIGFSIVFALISLAFAMVVRTSHDRLVGAACVVLFGGGAAMMMLVPRLNRGLNAPPRAPLLMTPDGPKLGRTELFTSRAWILTAFAMAPMLLAAGLVIGVQLPGVAALSERSFAERSLRSCSVSLRCLRCDAIP